MFLIYLTSENCCKFRNLKQTADPIITSTLRYITRYETAHYANRNESFETEVFIHHYFKLPLTISNGFLSQKLCIRQKPAKLRGSLNNCSYTASSDPSNFSSPARPQIVSQKHFNTKQENNPLSSKRVSTRRCLNTLTPSTICLVIIP